MLRVAITVMTSFRKTTKRQSRTFFGCIRFAPLLLLWAVVYSEAVADPQKAQRNGGAFQVRSMNRRDLLTQRKLQPTLEELIANFDSTACELNANGLYGDATIPNTVVEIVQYLYQISVSPGTSTLEMGTSILPELDSAIPTASLPFLFPDECSIGNVRHRSRILQSDSATVVAISKMPDDSFVWNDSIVCTKVVPDTDCYVGQGSATVIASGFLTRGDLKSFVVSAMQIAVQGDSFVGSLDSSAVVDITLLDDSLQILPPISMPIAAVPVDAPINTPFDSPTMSPVLVPFLTAPNEESTGVPSVANGTPSPESPGVPTPDSVSTPTTAPVQPPTGFDFPSFMNGTTRAPEVSTSNPLTTAPIGEDAPTMAPGVPQQPFAPIASGAPSALQDIDNRSGGGNDKIGWWAWLLTAVGACMILVCCFAILNKSSSNSGLIDPTVSRGQLDADPEDVAYEPPPSQPYVPPAVGAFPFSAPANTAHNNAKQSGGGFVNATDVDESEEESEEEEDSYAEGQGTNEENQGDSVYEEGGYHVGDDDEDDDVEESFGDDEVSGAW